MASESRVCISNAREWQDYISSRGDGPDLLGCGRGSDRCFSGDGDLLVGDAYFAPITPVPLINRTVHAGQCLADSENAWIIIS